MFCSSRGSHFGKATVDEYGIDFSSQLWRSIKKDVVEAIFVTIEILVCDDHTSFTSARLNIEPRWRSLSRPSYSKV